jgi:SlyX protein
MGCDQTRHPQAYAFQETGEAMSDELPDQLSRIDALEMRIAHQDQTIAELNDVITAQWRKIDALDRQIVKLRDEYQNMVAPRELPEPPPPHY